MVASLCLSVAILVAIGLTYTFARVWLVIPAIGAVILLIGYGSLAVFVSMAGVMAVTCGCVLAKVRTERFWMAATVAACLPYAVVAPSMIATYREVQQLRKDYPVQSLASRLAYEEPLRKAALSDTEPVVDSGPNESAVAKRLSQEFRRADSYRREEALAMLFDVHVEFASDFMNTEGEGDDRTPRRIPPRRAEVELPEPGPIPVAPEQEQDSMPSPDSTGEAQPDIEIVSRPDEELSGFHAEGVVDFARPASYGALDWRLEPPGGPNLDRVIGFQAHAFRHRPQFPQRRGSKWKIEQLQLVSLLKHQEPVAYVSENLPRMEELREAKTRPLSEFEESALEQLRSGKELVVHETRDTIEMLGALHAMNVCAQCHQVPRQTLLGAFTYRLHRPTPQGPKSAL